MVNLLLARIRSNIEITNLWYIRFTFGWHKWFLTLREIAVYFSVRIFVHLKFRQQISDIVMTATSPLCEGDIYNCHSYVSFSGKTCLFVIPGPGSWNWLVWWFFNGCFWGCQTDRLRYRLGANLPLYYCVMDPTILSWILHCVFELSSSITENILYILPSSQAVV